jgi:hypothetical protein
MGWLVPRLPRRRLRDEPCDDSPPQLPCIHAVLGAREAVHFLNLNWLIRTVLASSPQRARQL